MPILPTDRQSEIARYIEQHTRASGMAPTDREIAAAFGFKSQNSVRSHLRLMAQKGMVTRASGKARTLKVCRPTTDGIPVLGRIRAGVPFEAIHDSAASLPIPASLFRGRELFALRVKGDSMTGAGILSGDIAILNRQAEVENGEIAAVLLDDDATLKHFHRRKGTVVLRAANPSFSDIVIGPGDNLTVRVLGRFVGLIRGNGGGS